MEEKTTTETHERCFCFGAGPRLSDLFKQRWPETTRAHFRNSRIEFWKAIRSLIDDRIERLSRSQKGATVTVE